MLCHYCLSIHNLLSGKLQKIIVPSKKLQSVSQAWNLFSIKRSKMASPRTTKLRLQCFICLENDSHQINKYKLCHFALGLEWYFEFSALSKYNRKWLFHKHFMNLDCILCFYYEVNNNLQVSFIICVTHIYSTTKKHKKHSCLIFKFLGWQIYSQSKVSQYYKLTTLESQKVVAQKLYSTTYTECIKSKEHWR